MFQLSLTTSSFAVRNASPCEAPLSRCQLRDSFHVYFMTVYTKVRSLMHREICFPTRCSTRSYCVVNAEVARITRRAVAQRWHYVVLLFRRSDTRLFTFIFLRAFRCCSQAATTSYLLCVGSRRAPVTRLVIRLYPKPGGTGLLR